MPIVIDTREQEPWHFATETVRKKLAVGDYSLLGKENTVTIERKTLDDLVNTVIHQGKRFREELSKMASYEHRCVVVEASLSDIVKHRYTSFAEPSSVIGSVLSIIVDYRIPVYFLFNRPMARAFVQCMLERIERRERVR